MSAQLRDAFAANRSVAVALTVAVEIFAIARTLFAVERFRRRQVRWRRCPMEIWNSAGQMAK
jgi:hypothetical protein